MIHESDCWQNYIASRESLKQTSVIYAFVYDRLKPQSCGAFFEWFQSSIPTKLFHEYVSSMINVPVGSFIIKCNDRIIECNGNPLKTNIKSSTTTYRYLFIISNTAEQPKPNKNVTIKTNVSFAKNPN